MTLSLCSRLHYFCYLWEFFYLFVGPSMLVFMCIWRLKSEICLSFWKLFYTVNKCNIFFSLPSIVLTSIGNNDHVNQNFSQIVHPTSSIHFFPTVFSLLSTTYRLFPIYTMSPQFFSCSLSTLSPHSFLLTLYTYSTVPSLLQYLPRVISLFSAPSLPFTLYTNSLQFSSFSPNLLYCSLSTLSPNSFLLALHTFSNVPSLHYIQTVFSPLGIQFLPIFD